ncbi:MAG: LTA synthase family protein [Erysipelotrichaceae bacterium]|nr:LTA synthase family protein [Erysipelotrichaceae bacterium]
MLSAVFILIAYLFFVLYCVLDYTVFHLVEDLQVTSFSQILFNMNNGEGAQDGWNAAFKGFFDTHGSALVFVGLIALAAIVFCLYNWWTKNHAAPDSEEGEKASRLAPKIKVGTLVVMSGMIALTCIRTGFGLDEVGFYRWVGQRMTKSTFYKDNYVNPADVNVRFEGEKKNLIYIFCESMESSYADNEHGGFYDESLIPNMQRMSLLNNSFTDDNTVNGALCAESTGWTTAAILAQTSGTPMVYIEPHGQHNGKQEDWTIEDRFLPSLETLGDILERNGYHNSFLCGSNALYGGRANYFQQNGNYTIYDHYFLKESGYLPENEEEWKCYWGNVDKYLFDAAKDLITQEAETGEPFNFTMLTVDTHFPDGYVCPDCEDVHHGDQMKNAIACSEKRVYQFVKWIQEQPFYEDTVVVVAGDHLTMAAGLGRELKGFDRGVYFTILNGPEYNGPKRTYTTMDIFPTVVSAVGATYDGNRLGLGTNLFSDEPTLVETMGIQNLNDQIPLGTDYFIEEVLKSDSKNQGHVHE